jgi:hypothetical protein
MDFENDTSGHFLITPTIVHQSFSPPYPYVNDLVIRDFTSKSELTTLLTFINDENFPILERITVTQTSLTIVPLGFCSTLKATLKQIDLSHNRIQTIGYSGIFKNNDVIEKLNFSGNDLKMFPLKITGCANLREVDLSHNDLIQIDNVPRLHEKTTDVLFSGCPSLSRIDVSFNQLIVERMLEITMHLTNLNIGVVECAMNPATMYANDEDAISIMIQILTNKKYVAYLNKHFYNAIISSPSLHRMLLQEFIGTYTQNPSLIERHLNNSFLDEFQIELKAMLVGECTNLTSKLDQDELMIYIDDIGNRFCFTAKMFKEICQSNNHHNPYTGRKIQGEWLYQNCNIRQNEQRCKLRSSTCNTKKRLRDDKEKSIEKLTPSPIAASLIKKWTEDIYTFGKVFFSVPCDIQQELEQTIACTQTTRLYRGFSFKDRMKFLSFIGNSVSRMLTSEPKLFKTMTESNNTRNLEIFFNTFSSWTTEREVAESFAHDLSYGLLVSCEFSRDDILVDLNNVNLELAYKEHEVIVKPRAKHGYICFVEWWIISEGEYKDTGETIEELAHVLDDDHLIPKIA